MACAKLANAKKMFGGDTFSPMPNCTHGIPILFISGYVLGLDAERENDPDFTKNASRQLPFFSTCPGFSSECMIDRNESGQSTPIR